ncbi:MAG: DNA mismatch repair endonuclease MutL [Candidatus Thermoplasmatota archaeon]|nr:DNA mismatch repair endonuclease MutL [Candidatus Thermoplasmatota archaeon]
MASLEKPERVSIKQLDELTIGKIAAGEVVERPAQVVKELIENSIDAGADRVRVEIERGGFDRITIIDDGHGIPRDELRLAITRHATSKLSGPDDLSQIETKGFRGEALASIGAVSELIVASRIGESDGVQIRVDNGIVGDIEAAGIAPGTQIDVLNLFGKVPARLSFQRRPSTETAAIVDVGVQMALAEPKTGIIIEVDGRKVLDCPPAESSEDRLYDLFGSTSSELIPLTSSKVDDDAPGDEKWTGWISPPGLTRSRADDIHILVNGRPVAPGPFLQSVRRGYHTRLMVGRNPIGVLSLRLPANEVDVNVHPTKREVRLKNSWRVLERLERSIKHTLSQIATRPEASEETILESLSERVAENPTKSPMTNLPEWASAATENPTVQTRFSSIRQSVETPVRIQSKSTSEYITEQDTLPGMESEPTTPSLSSEERELHRHAVGSSTSPLDEPIPKSEVIPELPEMNPLAQLSNSYILAEGGDELFIIDQHALHERIRYERLREQMVSWEGQDLLTPISLSVGARQKASAISRQSTLENLGISFEAQNDSLLISRVPEVLIEHDSLEDFIQDLLIELVRTPDGTEEFDAVTNLRDHIAFMRSCRGAVKANEKLNLAQMRRLLQDMRTVPNPWACVHGRPTVLRLTMKHLDRHFGRHG